ncbi:hypothetical protein FHL15_005914 [Xylaria flabelliformis]|uniref:Uncharacterized protein n=1 Tax=Xylaria flabelliformis TaxID=2512241 RepID=A0A553HZI1_9PEZI|nr:hypothetical protein FHL15_005914 [Xylaria flabelliformis]
MRSLNMSFRRAHGARRLNIIIQPHLRFAYELLKLEELLWTTNGYELVATTWEQYCKAYGGGGVFNISNITDWDHAPDTQKKKHQERLLYKAFKVIQFLDPTQLTAKLTGTPQERDFQLRKFSSLSRPVTTSPTLSPDPGIVKEDQIRCYHWLIDAGGWTTKETRLSRAIGKQSRDDDDDEARGETTDKLMASATKRQKKGHA